MDLPKLQRVTVDALEDIKAHDIKVFDTLGQSSEFDRVIVATGNSNRQTRALAWNVVQKVKENGGHVVSVEGTDTGEWVLVDLGDVVVHIMQPAIRQYYGLEELWGAKPVRLRTPVRKRTRAPAAADSSRVARAGTPRAKPAAKTRRASSVVAAKSAVKKKSGKSAAGKQVHGTTAKSAARGAAARATKVASRPAAKKTEQGRSRKTAAVSAKARAAAGSAKSPAAMKRAVRAPHIKSRPAKKF